ncbi:MAG TPA: family 78 glycoside hydrolase catalytic domain, partial [Tepidisphaeraceae bacterium]|nr:family 78 glycoside hydrolase catalytic domain [Tepidisphaeraceae bacterium]
MPMSPNQPPIHLRCEYFENPLVIDVPQPRLSWRLNDDRRGAAQSAYEIHVASTPQLLADGKVDLWNSGKVASDLSIQVPYGGKPLQSRQRCHWAVRYWDAGDAPSPWSEPASWEMGLLNRDDWTANWIGAPIVGGPYTIPPAAYLRRAFSLNKRIAGARLYVTALGLHEFEINGQRVGNDRLTPGRTEYLKRVPYHVYDVTALLAPGDNACGAVLGDGWYCGHLHSDPRQTYGDRPRLLAQLEVQFDDRTSVTIASDSSWQSSEGPIRSSDLLMGEDYDARQEMPGWSRPGFEASRWRPVELFDHPQIEIVAPRTPPVRPTRQVKPIAPPKVSANKRRWVFDLGQNIVGVARLKIRNAPPGHVIDLRYTEMLDKDGKPYTQALRTARAIDHYTTKGGEEETYEPHFTFHGFRFVEVRDCPGTPTIDDLTGIVLHSDLPETG